jgi:hypothetical protein
MEPEPTQFNHGQIQCWKSVIPRTTVTVLHIIRYNLVGQDSTEGTSTRHGIGDLENESQTGKIFHTHPQQCRGPPSLLYNVYQVSIPGEKQPGCGTDHPPHISTEVKRTVQLHLYSPLQAFMACFRISFTFYYVRNININVTQRLLYNS